MRDVNSSRVRRSLSSSLLFAGSLLALLLATPLDGQQKQAANVAGGDCLQCHEDLAKTFSLRPHGKSAQFMTGATASTCETCHGDGRKHSESADPKDIMNPAKLSAAEVSDTCLTCHSRDQTHVAWRGSPHDRRDMSCLSCHQEHHV